MESDFAVPHRHVVLLVDDYEPLREALTRMLETGGYTVRGAGTGLDALKAIALTRPCVIFLDIALPDMRAPDLVRRLGLAGARDRPPIVLISGDGDALARNGSTVEGLLLKPVDRRALLAAVEHHARCPNGASSCP